MRLLVLATLSLLSCRTSTGPIAEAEVGVATTPKPPATGHGSGRDRWRGGGVYLDGQPIGVLRFAELPAGLEPIWETQRSRLPFQAGEPIRYRETKVPRYRITDYLRASGIELADVVEVQLLGARDTAIALTRKQLQTHPDEILFKFASDTSGKAIPLIRNIKIGTSFDDLSALTIYVKRTPPRLTAEQSLELDGQVIRGIPYHGEPMREGVRVYVDDRLVAMLKRTELVTASRWSLASVLEKRGVATTRLARMELIHNDDRAAAVPWQATTEIAFQEGASGEILVGSDQQPANAVALYTR